jgi:hypothetical protein
LFPSTDGRARVRPCRYISLRKTTHFWRTPLPTAKRAPECGNRSILERGLVRSKAGWRKSPQSIRVSSRARSVGFGFWTRSTVGDHVAEVTAASVSHDIQPVGGRCREGLQRLADEQRIARRSSKGPHAPASQAPADHRLRVGCTARAVSTAVHPAAYSAAIFSRSAAAFNSAAFASTNSTMWSTITVPSMV